MEKRLPSFTSKNRNKVFPVFERHHDDFYGKEYTNAVQLLTGLGTSKDIPDFVYLSQ